MNVICEENPRAADMRAELFIIFQYCNDAIISAHGA